MQMDSAVPALLLILLSSLFVLLFRRDDKPHYNKFCGCSFAWLKQKSWRCHHSARMPPGSPLCVQSSSITSVWVFDSVGSIHFNFNVTTCIKAVCALSLFCKSFLFFEISSRTPSVQGLVPEAFPRLFFGLGSGCWALSSQFSVLKQKTPFVRCPRLWRRLSTGRYWILAWPVA